MVAAARVALRLAPAVAVRGDRLAAGLPAAADEAPEDDMTVVLLPVDFVPTVRVTDDLVPVLFVPTALAPVDLAPVDFAPVDFKPGDFAPAGLRDDDFAATRDRAGVAGAPSSATVARLRPVVDVAPGFAAALPATVAGAWAAVPARAGFAASAFGAEAREPLRAADGASAPSFMRTGLLPQISSRW